MASCMALTAGVSSGRAARISTVVPSVSSAYTLARAVTGVMLIAASKGRPARPVRTAVLKRGRTRLSAG